MSDDLDPRPVFDGDWNSATGVQKGEHSERVRQWKARNGLLPAGRMGKGSEQPPRRPQGDDATAAAIDPRNRAVLEGIRDDRNALPSDRIRATQTLLQAERGADAQGQGDSDLVALRQVLDTLAPHERLAWLQGEREETMGSALRA
jgi:hypothetical protein